MITLRRMLERDVEEVTQIEGSVVEFPWSYGIFRDCIKVGYDCWVFEDQDEIIGYGLLSIGAGEAHILNICIRPDRQRNGLGTRMMKHLMQRADELKAQSVYLEVRASNKGAFDLYQDIGFSVIGRRKDYYPHKNGREDAIVLELCFRS